MSSTKRKRQPSHLVGRPNKQRVMARENMNKLNMEKKELRNKEPGMFMCG
jgi:hypothetical protein